MNSIVLLVGVYTFLDYYYDTSPIKNVKLAISILTLPTVLVMLTKLMRMGFYAIPYLFVQSLEYMTLSYWSKIYKSTFYFRWNFVSDMCLYEYIIKNNGNFYTKHQVYTDKFWLVYKGLDNLSVSIQKYMDWTKNKDEDYVAIEDLEKYSRYDIFCLRLLNIFYFSDSGLISLCENDHWNFYDDSDIIYDDKSYDYHYNLLNQKIKNSKKFRNNEHYNDIYTIEIMKNDITNNKCMLIYFGEIKKDMPVCMTVERNPPKWMNDKIFDLLNKLLYKRCKRINAKFEWKECYKVIEESDIIMAYDTHNNIITIKNVVDLEENEIILAYLKCIYILNPDSDTILLI